MGCKDFARAVAGALLLFVVAGCGGEEIRRYQVARTPEPPLRILAAILPHGEKVWFVSVLGPESSVGDVQPTFDQFVRTIRFPAGDDPPITWTTPESWQAEESAEGLRYATYRAGPGGLEVKVHYFGAEAGDLLGNVNRWRRQVGLDELTADKLPQATRALDVNGVRATLVDMTGPADAERKKLLASATAGHAQALVPKSQPTPPAARGDRPLTYTVPAGWTEQNVPPNSIRVASFRVTDGGRSGEVTIIPLGGAAGGLESNVNRWRGEVGLADATGDQIRSAAKSLDVAGSPASYVDLSGSKGRMLAVIAPRGEQTWFFKFVGPAELLGAQQAAFESFVRSIRFTAGG